MLTKLLLKMNLIFITSLLPRALAQVSPEVPADIDFKILHTPHFEVIFDSKHKALAEINANKLEQAYGYLSGFLTARPDKTVVILNDRTDLTNGYATRIPYPHIMIYPVLQTSQDSLSESGDWPLELVAHEYTHILTFEPIGPHIRFLRSIFGSIISPNLLLPTWWKEGVAVHIESAIGNHGRLRSRYQDSMIRAFSLDRSLIKFDLSDANEAYPIWPEGARPYVLGSLLWSQMIADRGNDTMENLFQRHGGRMPYFINTPADDLFDKDYNGEFQKALLEFDGRAKKQIAELRKAPITPFRFLTEKYKYTSGPAISPNGRWLAVVAVDENKKRFVKFFRKNQSTLTDMKSDLRPDSKPELKLNSKHEPKKVDVDPLNTDQLYFDMGDDGTGEIESVPKSKPFDGPPAGTIQRVSWFHNREAVVYDKVDHIDRIHKFSDLAIYDLSTKETTNLTSGLRAREPSVSPDDQEIAYIQLDAAKTSLALFDIQKKTGRILFEAPYYERISQPIYWSATQIIYSHRTTSGDENLYLFDIPTRTRQLLFEGQGIIEPKLPRKTKEGLLFVASSNGTMNLYLADSNLHQAHPITHTETAVLGGDLDPESKQLLATVMTPKGPQVKFVNYQTWKNTPADLPKIQPLAMDRYPKKKASFEGDATEGEIQQKWPEYDVSDYSSGSYLWPHYWIPFMSTSSESNGLVISAQTSGFDPLKKHAYEISGLYDTGTGYGDLSAVYHNNVTSLPLAAGIGKTHLVSPLPHLLSTETLNIFEFYPDVYWLSPDLTFGLGWSYSQFYHHDGEFNNYSSGPRTSLLYQNYSKGGAQISPETGFGLNLDHTEYLHENTSVPYYKTKASFLNYFSRWLPQHQVLAFKANYFDTQSRTLGKSLSVYHGTGNTSIFPNVDSSASSFVLRGYKINQFIGYTVYNANLEYRFPISDIYRGNKSKPYFLNRIYGLLFVDGASLDGIHFTDDSETYVTVDHGRPFYSTGLEFKLDTTIGYVLPMTWVLGAYWPLNSETIKSPQIGVGLQLGGL